MQPIKEANSPAAETARPRRERRDVAASVRAALAAGVEFVLARQEADGAWRDFRLAPGLSDAWVTAYVAGRLFRIAHICPLPRHEPALASATRFLREARHPGGGWGFNETCEVDCDSTAHAVLFLHDLGAPKHLADYARLARFQRADGGFATFRRADRADGWGRSHPEVTATALRALRGVLAADHDALARGAAYLRARGAEPSRLSSYWWTGSGYMARELAALARDLPAVSPPRRISAAPRTVAATCFDQALRLEATVLLGGATDTAAAERLAQRQSLDGGWPSGPILRVTDPGSRAIGDERFHASYVARDERRLFTTITVAAALARYLERSKP